jgi:predicted TIM-barrel fold metal-dependent hydrolase
MVNEVRPIGDQPTGSDEGTLETSGIRRKLLARCTCCVDALAAAPVSRRRFLAGGVAALGLGAAAGFAPSATAQTKPHRIDVHHHVSPPPWLEGLRKLSLTNRPMADWSVYKTIEDMDKGGVATAITSPTTPQTKPFDKAEATRIARESNDYAKKLMADHPGRFGIFAMLPLPHVDESLKEIAYAFDTLKVDGDGGMTSYGDKWLGYAEFAPVWEELNRRKATVYTHPTGANCCVNLVQGIGEAAIEYGTDTTRTIANLIFSGTSRKYPDINWIPSPSGSWCRW